MKTRQFTLDLPLDAEPPEPGDIISKPRSTFEVVSVRPVESRVWGGRWMLTCRPVDFVRVEDLTDAKVWPTRGYAKGETPRSVFDPPQGLEDTIRDRLTSDHEDAIDRGLWDDRMVPDDV